MLKLIAPVQMRAQEARYFKRSNVKSIDAMERAATALARAVSRDFTPGARIYCVCGTGGNGGDGTACARLLKGRYAVTILQPKPPRTPDAIENLRRARECGIAILENADGLPEPDAWVDALFGTGLTRAPSGAEAALIDRMNASPARVIAADIPSGLNGETGAAFSHCVRADRTIAFGFAKPGLFLQDGLDCAGRVTIDSIGFPDSEFASDALLLRPADISENLPPRATPTKTSAGISWSSPARSAWRARRCSRQRPRCARAWGWLQSPVRGRLCRFCNRSCRARCACPWTKRTAQSPHPPFRS